jgi:hypothetical protein
MTDNRGMLPGTWGPSAWIFLHSSTFGYPINPTIEEKKQYLKYYQCLGNVLPCESCRVSYQKFIQTGDTKLTMDVMETRSTLVKWGFTIHNAVNNKLGIDYGLSFDEFNKIYESCRVICRNDQGIMSDKDKAYAYTNIATKTPPIIPIDIAKLFINYAILHGYHGFEQNINYYSLLNHSSKEWKKRNKTCIIIINYMHKKGINALINNKPSKYELLLFSMLSCTLPLNKIIKIAQII